MMILLVGVSCVGKTTIGKLLADRLGTPFFDLGEEIERHFDTSIERLQARFLTDYEYRKACSVVLQKIAAGNQDCVIALVPSGLRDAYLRVVRKLTCVTIAIEDSPENIVERITFYDIDSKLIHKQLTKKEKDYYRQDIAADIRYFRKTYKRADIHADITGLDAEASAELLQALLAAHDPLDAEPT